MARVLEGAHALERDRAADVDVGRGDVDPELDAQRPPERELRLEPALGQDVDGVPRRGRRAATGLDYRALWRMLRKRNRRAEAAPHPQAADCSRCSLVLGAARATAFTFGMLRAVASQIPELDPYSQQHRRQNSYVYASDGHTILAILRGSQARVIVPSADDLALDQARDRRDRGQALLRAPRHRPPRDPARALGRHHPRRRRSRAARRSPSSSSRTRYNGNAPTITRKLREAALAWQLEQVWSKDQILTAYLNTIYFGNGAYGVEEACRVYFGHSAEDGQPGRGGAARRRSRRTRASTTRSPTPRLRPRRAATSSSTRCTSSTTSTTSSSSPGCVEF